MENTKKTDYAVKGHDNARILMCALMLFYIFGLAAICQAEDMMTFSA